MGATNKIKEKTADFPQMFRQNLTTNESLLRVFAQRFWENSELFSIKSISVIRGC